MIYNSIGTKKFNIPFRIFNNNDYFAFSKVGTFLIDNSLGPDGGEGIDHNKANSIKKAFSEMLERRALMVGVDKTRNIKSLNLVDKRCNEIPLKNFCYSTDKFSYNDTTGAAAHLKGSKALLNALVEIIQKNELLIFWYLKQGYSIRTSDILNKVKIDGVRNYKNIQFFISNYFKPLITSICIVFDKCHECIISSGLGTDTNVYKAIRLSFEEMKLIKEQDTINKKYSELLGNIRDSNYVDAHSTLNSSEYLLKFTRNFAYYNIGKWEIKDEMSIFKIVNALPPWIKTLFVALLPNTINPSMKIVKIISDELFNSIPIKEIIFRNKKLHNFPFDFESLNTNIIEAPDCPVI
ncbi:MAG: hypothetical protein ACE3JK_12500 [Sporolactobacillus sp.]